MNAPKICALPHVSNTIHDTQSTKLPNCTVFTVRCALVNMVHDTQCTVRLKVGFVITQKGAKIHDQEIRYINRSSPRVGRWRADGTSSARGDDALQRQ